MTTSKKANNDSVKSSLHNIYRQQSISEHRGKISARLISKLNVSKRAGADHSEQFNGLQSLQNSAHEEHTEKQIEPYASGQSSQQNQSEGCLQQHFRADCKLCSRTRVARVSTIVLRKRGAPCRWSRPRIA